MAKNKLTKYISVSLLAMAIILSGGVFCFQTGVAEAKKKTKSSATKWQKMLERNGVDRALWEKYLPKISRKEYQKVAKALKKAGSVSGGSGSLGPDIRIGLFRLIDDNDKKVKITSNTGFNIKDKYGNVYKLS